MTVKFQTNKAWQVPRLVAKLEERHGRLAHAWNPELAGSEKFSAMEKFGQALRFMYMGNSEFGYSARSIEHMDAYIARNKVIPLVVPVSVGLNDLVNVYVLTPRKFKDHVANFLNNRSFWQLSEPTGFEQALAGEKDAYTPVGWFDLDNQVMFFLDKNIFEKARVSMGVKTTLPDADRHHSHGPEIRELSAF